MSTLILRLGSWKKRKIQKKLVLKFLFPTYTQSKLIMKQILVLKQISTSFCKCKTWILNEHNCFIYLHLQAKAGVLNWRNCIEKRKMSCTLFVVKNLVIAILLKRKFQPLPSLCNCQSEPVLVWEWIVLLLFTVENPGGVVVWAHTDSGSGWYLYLATS